MGQFGTGVAISACGRKWRTNMHDNQYQELFDVPAPANPAANHFVHELLEEGSMSQFRKRTGTGQIDLLVSAAEAGSAAAFEQLYRLYSGIVFRSYSSSVRC